MERNGSRKATLNLLDGAHNSAIFRTPKSIAASYPLDNDWFEEFPLRTTLLREVEYDFFDTCGRDGRYGPLWGIVQLCHPGFHFILPIWYGPAFWMIAPVDDAGIAHLVAAALESGGYDKNAYEQYLKSRGLPE